MQVNALYTAGAQLRDRQWVYRCSMSIRDRVSRPKFWLGLGLGAAVSPPPAPVKGLW